MVSPTLGQVTIKEAAQVIAERAGQSNVNEYNVMIGTDSQNHDDTKVVVVVALHHIGHGGIFFYEIHHVNRISNIGQKLLYETQLSLNCAEQLVNAFEEIKANTGYDYERHMSLSIHVDAGQNGPSKQSIPAIIGWISACGYQAVVKPDSVAACSIANKFSK